jgi:hypothetical protein
MGVLSYFTDTGESLLGDVDTHDCHPVFRSEEDRLRASVGDPAAYRRILCAPDGGFMFATVQGLSAAQTNGRLRYNPDKAGACVAAGRQVMVWGDGGYVMPEEFLDGGPPPGYDDCFEAFQGLQGEGEPCLHDVECAQGAQGAVCIRRQGADCQGECRARGLENASCGEAWAPPCAQGLECVWSDAALGTCRPRPGLNQPCRVAGGRTVDCAEGLFCDDNGRCAAPLGEDAPCQPYNSQCREGLYCDQATSVCTQPKGLDQVCSRSPGERTCQPCLKCFARQVGAGADAGPPRCRVYAAEGAPCVDAPCHAGLACILGTCRALAASGQGCQVDPTDLTLRGSCLNITEVCTGTPPVCSARMGENDPCTAPAGSLPTQGTCAADLQCLRSTPSATTGTCKQGAAPGQPCGYVQDTPSQCRAPESSWAYCSVSSDGGLGFCVTDDLGSLGDPCTSTWNCQDHLYCSASGGNAGTCQPASALSESCDYGQGKDQRCAQGWCQDLGQDGGWESRCVAFRVAGDLCQESQECGPDLACSAETGRCVARAGEGQPCGDSDECRVGHSCRDGVCMADRCEASVLVSSSCLDGNFLPLLLFYGFVGVGVGAVRRRRRG